ncbi:universal stress protein [Paraoerskovia marina]|uniref:universal stress protein n=1 Tax=Paraoerskovia marina TaxID=545619 RepID=UPI000492345B|nr:universal stress protein [Paraoerskovia marina]
MTIVVGHLATAEGQEALNAAIAEGERTGGEVVVVVSRRDGAVPETEDAELDQLGARFVDAGVTHQIRVVNESVDVADDLVSAALEVDAELLVIGLRRRSPVGKLILGSSAQRILLEAPCPVLAVKPARP